MLRVGVVHLGYRVLNTYQAGAMPQVVGQKIGHMGDAGVQGLLDYAAQGALVQAVGQRIDRNQSPCVDKLFLSLENIVVRRLEHDLSPKDADLPAEDYLRPRYERAGEPGLIEPDCADVSGVIPKYGLSRFLARPLSGFRRLPDRQNSRLLLAGRQLEHLAHICEVVMPVRKQVNQVFDRCHAQPLQLRQIRLGDAAYSRQVVFQREFRRRGLACRPTRGSFDRGARWRTVVCRRARGSGVRQVAHHGVCPRLSLRRRQDGV